MAEANEKYGHNYQENIDCLDYLIYSLKKSNENR